MSATIGIARQLGADVAGLEYDEAGSAGTNVFVDSSPDSPDNAVIVYSDGGPGADSKLPYDSPAVQIVFRTTANPTWALATAAAVYSKIHARRHVTLPNGVELVWALFTQSQPRLVGTDTAGRLLYSMNLQMEVKNATQERP